MPTICEPCPGKTNARSPTSDARIAAAPLSVETWRKFRYTRSAVNQRRYVQRERARRAARTSSAIESAALRDVSRRGYADLRVTEVARRGGLRVRPSDAIALAHALLSYPTWRTALTGPGRRRAPRLIYSALRSALL